MTLRATHSTLAQGSGSAATGDYNDDVRKGYYGIGGGTSHGYEQGRRDREAADARMRGSGGYQASSGGHSEGDGQGVILLLGIVAVGAGIWTMRYLIGFALGAMVVSALALKAAAALTGARIGWWQALLKTLGAYGIALLVGTVIFGGAAASLALGGPEIIPGFGEMAYDGWWAPDAIVGNVLVTLTIPALLMLGAAIRWLDRSVEPGTVSKVVRWLALGGSLVVGPIVAAMVGSFVL